MLNMTATSVHVSVQVNDIDLIFNVYYFVSIILIFLFFILLFCITAQILKETCKANICSKKNQFLIYVSGNSPSGLINGELRIKQEIVSVSMTFKCACWIRTESMEEKNPQHITSQSSSKYLINCMKSIWI